jgi:hypothetical protein
MYKVVQLCFGFHHTHEGGGETFPNNIKLDRAIGLVFQSLVLLVPSVLTASYYRALPMDASSQLR